MYAIRSYYVGQNLVLNMADHRFRVAVYNRTAAVTERFVAEHPDTPGGLSYNFV